jgi:lipopolysaccharide/colanic/teichoic acid biosynthesis glycosyltransferase
MRGLRGALVTTAETLRRASAHSDVADAPHVSWQPRSSALRIRVFSALLIIDVLAVAVSFMLAATVRGIFAAETSWLLFLVTLLPIYFAVAITIRAYAPSSFADPVGMASKGVKALGLSIGTIIFIAFYLKSSEELPRATIAIASATSITALFTGRFFAIRHMASIVGGNPFSVVLIREFDQPIPSGTYSVMIAAETFFDPELHDPVMYDRLARSLGSADRVVIACHPDRRIAWARALKGANIQSEIIVSELTALAPLGIGMHGSEPTVVVATGPLDLFDRAVKRVFDLSIAIMAVICLTPLMLVVTVLIKLDSPGPVFFRQQRIGRGNQMFHMLKFRSMRTEASDSVGARLTARDDDRVTRVGRFIRKTSIDELPQLLHVLSGEMSIVGPRPHALGAKAADKLYWEVDERYWTRHAAKPGLTGLAQVRGYRGNTLEESDLSNRLQADLEYLDTWSIWRDVKIVVLTFRVLLHRNAF